MKKFTNSLLAAAAVISSISVVSATDTSSKTGAYLGVSGGAANTNVKYSYTNAGAIATSNGPGNTSSSGSAYSNYQVANGTNVLNAGNTQAGSNQSGNFGGLFGCLLVMECK